MSWFRGYASVEAFNNDIPDGPIQEVPEDQLAIARQAAKLLIGSPALGIDKDFRINLSGHSNPDHEPKTGWANDCVSVSVSQK